MIKTLYAINDERAAKCDSFKNACDSNDQSFIENKVGINIEEDTIGEIALKILSFYCDIPTEFWSKNAIDMAEDDIKMLKRLNNGIIEFNRAN